MSYRITIRTTKGDILAFTKVDKFTIIGNRIVFIDTMTLKEKNFPSINADIEVE